MRTDKLVDKTKLQNDRYMGREPMTLLLNIHHQRQGLMHDLKTNCIDGD